MRRILPDDKWRAEKLATLPVSWSRKLERQVAALLSTDNSNASNFHVNTLLRETVEHLDVCVLPANASDADINDHAATCARRVRDILSLPVSEASRHDSLNHHCIANRTAPPSEKIVQGARVARMLDPHWWRRGLRRAQARDIEGAAIKLGFVHARAEKYVSEESFQRRAQQVRRNRKMLEATTMVNEDGEQFTLQQLSDKSVANPELRKGEMMLRIRGFEEIARERGDACLFATITCPSRMHAKLYQSGEGNPHYDGTTPKDAQNYLRIVWARFRAAVARAQIAVYGFRVCEPHHDGCPHWHVLLFVPAREKIEALQVVQSTLRRYALADSPNEPGAQERRCRFETIDLTTGSAAGYVAKYISKAVGLSAGEISDAEPILRSRANRVPAWASTHGIRQFQQLGGAPVGLWRELRKVPYHALGKRPPKALAQSWQAANRKDNQKCDFSAFLAATGGVTIKRKQRKLKIAWQWSDREGKYGEAIGDEPVGISVLGGRKIYASVRKVWQIVAPWTRVNNCTQLTAQNLGNIIQSTTVKGIFVHPPDKEFHHGTSLPRFNPKTQPRTDRASDHARPR
jgi:Bacteriophage replication gene A protein (GPA)